MSSREPFSDEELAQLSERTSSPNHAIVGASYEERCRLIAQAREANQLREENALLKQQAANVLILQPDELKDMCERIVRGREDPAARAKRELGERLFRERVGVVEHNANWPDAERWTASVILERRLIMRHAPTQDEAIVALAQAAKESGR